MGVVSWKIDGRKGMATLRGTQLFGFALMRDPNKRIIAFEGSRDRALGSSPWPLPPPDSFVIDEDTFKPESG